MDELSLKAEQAARTYSQLMHQLNEIQGLIPPELARSRSSRGIALAFTNAEQSYLWFKQSIELHKLGV